MNNNNIIPDKTIASLVQQHLVQDDQESNHSVHSDPIDPANLDEIPVPYHLPGTAVTHDIYTHANSLVNSNTLQRSKSYNDLKQRGGKLVHDSDQDETEYENLDKPGGFRRFHIQQQHLLANEVSSNHSNQDNTDSNSDNNNNNEVSAFQELFRPDSLCSTESHTYTDYTGILRIDSMSPSVSESFRTYNPSTVGRTRHFLEYLAITSVMDKFAGENLSDSEDEDTPDEETGLSESTSLLPPNYIGHKKKKRPRAKKATPEHKADIQKTIFLLFKAFIGSGILFLPKAFSNGGLVFSVFIMWLMGGLSLYNFLLLNDCKRFLSGSYGDMGGSLYGPWMRQTVLFSVAISQLGFMCGGTIFIVQNIVEAVRALSNNAVHLNSTAVYVVLALLLMPLVLIRNIAKLSPTALLSDALIIAGLIVLLVYDGIQIFETSPPTSGPNIHWWFNPVDFPVFVGTAVYSYEGIGLLIPIRDSMEKPEKFPVVLGFVMVFVATILCCVGILGYVAFGDKVETVALLNLPAGTLPNSVQLGYGIAVLLSNALCLFPTVRIIEQGLFGERSGKRSLFVKWQKNTVRASVVVLGTLIAWAGANDLDKFISLIGSICCCPLSLIFPPLFHLALPDTKGSKRIIDLALIIFGFGVMLFTFYNTSMQWASSG